MKTHRFFITQERAQLKHDFWLHDKELLHQWKNVLRFNSGQEVVLFDGVSEDRLYSISEISDQEAHLKLITEFERKLPTITIYLAWSLLKKDKNEWVVQKCTELGVSHFLPLITDRSTPTDISQFRLERLKKIAIEASEQCGRSDIPTVREPMHVKTFIDEFQEKLPIYVCEQGQEHITGYPGELAILVGPEGGWSDEEKQIFEESKANYIGLHDFTLRAETACVSAATLVLK